MEDLYKIMREIERETNLTQRSLAERMGCSLGKINYLMSSLMAKGFVKLENFSKSSNKLGYRYILTPEGLKEKIRVTGDFLKRKELEYERLRGEIEELKGEVLRTQ